MKKIKSFVIKTCFSLLSVSFFTSCLSTSDVVEGKGDITSLEWRLISVKSVDASQELKPVLGNLPTLRVIENKANGSTGCNNYNGSILVNGYSIKFGRLITTKKFCVDGAAVENAVLNAFGTVDNYTVVKGNLQLKKGQEVMAVFTSFR